MGDWLLGVLVVTYKAFVLHNSEKEQNFLFDKRVMGIEPTYPAWKAGKSNKYRVFYGANYASKKAAFILDYVKSITE